MTDQHCTHYPTEHTTPTLWAAAAATCRACPHRFDCPTDQPLPEPATTATGTTEQKAAQGRYGLTPLHAAVILWHAGLTPAQAAQATAMPPILALITINTYRRYAEDWTRLLNHRPGTPAPAVDRTAKRLWATRIVHPPRAHAAHIYSQCADLKATAHTLALYTTSTYRQRYKLAEAAAAELRAILNTKPPTA